MALQMGTHMAKRHQILHREISPLCHGTVVARRRVSLGQDKTVSVRILRVLRIDVHLFKIQISKNVRCRQRSAGMSCFCTVHSSHDTLTDFIGNFL